VEQAQALLQNPAEETSAAAQQAAENAAGRAGDDAADRAGRVGEAPFPTDLGVGHHGADGAQRTETAEQAVTAAAGQAADDVPHRVRAGQHSAVGPEHPSLTGEEAADQTTEQTAVDCSQHAADCRQRSRARRIGESRKGARRAEAQTEDETRRSYPSYRR